MPQAGSLTGARSSHLQNSRRLDHGRLALAFRKSGGFRTVRIDAGKPLAVIVKNGHLPVLVLAPFIFSEQCAFSCCFCFGHGPDYLNHGARAQVPIRALRREEYICYVLLSWVTADTPCYRKSSPRQPGDCPAPPSIARTGIASEDPHFASHILEERATPEIQMTHI